MPTASQRAAASLASPCHVGLDQVWSEELGREHKERQREDHSASRLALACLGEAALAAAV